MKKYFFSSLVPVVLTNGNIKYKCSNDKYDNDKSTNDYSVALPMYCIQLHCN